MFQLFNPSLGEVGTLFPRSLVKSIDIKLRGQSVVAEGRSLVRQALSIGGERYEATVRSIPLKRGSNEFQQAIATMGLIRGRSTQFYIPMPVTTDTALPAIGDYVSIAGSTHQSVRQVVTVSTDAISSGSNSSGTYGSATVHDASVTPLDSREALYIPSSFVEDLNSTLHGAPVLYADATGYPADSVSNATESSGVFSVISAGLPTAITFPTLAGFQPGSRVLIQIKARHSRSGVTVDLSAHAGGVEASYELSTALRTIELVGVATSTGEVTPQMSFSSGQVQSGDTLTLTSIMVTPLLYLDQARPVATNTHASFAPRASAAQASGVENNMLVSMNSDIHEIRYAENDFIEFEFDIVERL